LGNPLSLLDPRVRRFEKIWNTFVRISLPWAKTLRADYWEHRRLGDDHGPHQFVELQAGSFVLLDEVAKLASGPASPILDLGCNVGRHLDALYRRGFTNLYGVDVQRSALDHMRDVFPDMCKASHIKQGTFQDYLPGVDDRFFDVVFTYGATVELVPPSFPICGEMARTAGRAVVLKINESGHAYPRLWETEFRRAGFILTKLLRPVAPDDFNSLLVFERMKP